MPDHLFIAEKSSLAEEVAKSWAEKTGVAASRSSTHWTVGGDAVTWLAGHMYEQAQPQEYDQRYSQWNIDDLPMVPKKWRLIPVKDKVSRLKDVKALIKDASKLVNVGDAGREGQLLVDEVIIEAGFDPFAPNVKRLWVKSLARKDMLAAMAAMFPNADKRSLYESAIARQRADWLYGMNLTRLYTVLARRSGMAVDKPLSVGRVQTPTERLVVDRDREIAKFRAVDHFSPTGFFRHANGTFKASWIIPPDHEGTDHEGRLVDKAVAERIAAKVAGKKGPVESFEVKKKSKAPPLPYALSNLQKECSAKFGFGATRTLEVAQSLYEKKVTTYPRSDSQYLPSAIYTDEAPGILDNLAKTRDYGPVVAKATRSLKSSAWNDAKVSDHHAIIPTTEATAEKIDALPADERRVFDLIAKTFLAQFYPDFRWDAMVAVVSVEGERFKASGRRVTDQGWKVVYGKDLEKDDEEEDEGDALPQMAKGDPVTVEKSGIESKRTTPPSHFTEGTLIEAMKNVHRFVPDSEAKKKLKESSGIGTEATRAAILETLKGRDFLAPKGKFIVSTPRGQSLIDVLDGKIKDPALTALWEEQLDKVNGGELTCDKFLSVLVGEITATVGALANTTIKIAGSKEPLAGTGEVCPSCGKGRLRTQTVASGPRKGDRFLSCDAYKKDDPASCKFSKWPDDKPVEKLPGDGETCPSCGKGSLRTRAVASGANKGKRFLSCDAYKKDDPKSCRYAKWPEDKPVEKLPGDGETCPSCGKGSLRTRAVATGPHKGKKFLSCDAYKKDDPNSCRFSKWPEVAVQKIAGDGDLCPSCGKGKMRTRVSSKDKKPFLSCDAYDKNDPDTCRHAIWPKPKVDPLPGEGELCEKCADGRMRTRVSREGQRFLSCDGYKKDDPASCRFAKWPDQKDGKSYGGGKPAAKPAAKAPARKVAGRR